jgi:hypothetical protein
LFSRENKDAGAAGTSVRTCSRISRGSGGPGERCGAGSGALRSEGAPRLPAAWVCVAAPRWIRFAAPRRVHLAAPKRVSLAAPGVGQVGRPVTQLSRPRDSGGAEGLAQGAEVMAGG